VPAVTALVSPVAYGTSVVVAAVACAALCAAGRRGRPAGRVLGLVLLAVATSWVVQSAVQGPWTAAGSLPLPLCDAALVVAGVACWWPHPLLVELTWFWGMAGTLQAVITPDLGVAFPHLLFFEYVVGHLGIVAAALYLVTGLRIAPRRGAVARTFAITLAYTALVGVADAATGGNYMFLRSRPATWSILSVLGPWPWYIPGAAAVALVLLVLLDLPFRARARMVARATEASALQRTAAR
jgi:hypothetical integral membrane protein (TIGR02206 family)